MKLVGVQIASGQRTEQHISGEQNLASDAHMAPSCSRTYNLFFIKELLLCSAYSNRTSKQKLPRQEMDGSAEQNASVNVSYHEPQVYSYASLHQIQLSLNTYNTPSGPLILEIHFFVGSSRVIKGKLLKRWGIDPEGQITQFLSYQ
jgi:hypothetical protein